MEFLRRWRLPLFVARRLGKMVVLVLAIVVMNFLLIHAAPGDPATVMAGQSGAADPKYVEQLRQQFGLDKPLPEQLFIYVSRVVQLDLGRSHRLQRKVSDIIGERLPATLLLTGTAFGFALVLGTALGTLAMRYHGTALDTAIIAATLVFYATPLFWVGLLLVLVFSVWLNWLPSFGMATVGANLEGMAFILDRAQYLVLPVITLGMFYTAIYARLSRSAMLEVADQQFVTTAKAKGATDRRILWRHIFRNALLPVVTMAGIQAGQLIGGSIVIETVFAWPGIGSLAFDALLQRDYETLLGIFLCTSVLVLMFNLVTDLLYLAIDPRMEAA
jgi:peptide/nickel transport system permease protein